MTLFNSIPNRIPVGVVPYRRPLSRVLRDSLQGVIMAIRSEPLATRVTPKTKAALAKSAKKAAVPLSQYVAKALDAIVSRK